MSHLKNPVDKNDHIQGLPDAGIVIVEYGDYECPHCSHAYPIVKKFKEKHPDKVAFVFRNFPIQEIHEEALNAAITTEAAGKQEEFWEMHDMIYENQPELNERLLTQYAKKLGINMKKLQEDMEHTEVQNKVNEDFIGGIKSGVNSTPTFFVNGVKWDGYDGTYESFLKLLS